MCTNDSMPLVSILIPTHERPHFFSLALASAVNQTYKNIEIIISDNSLDDETEQIVHKFQKVYHNIRYFHSPGIDMHSNWQMCWDNISAESKYINFLMDDDIFAEDKIDRMMAYFIKMPDLALVTSYRMLIDKDGNPLDDCGFNSPISSEDSIISGQEAGTSFLLNCVNWIGEPTTVLFNRSYTSGFFRGWSGNEKYLILDYPLWLRILEKGDMVYIADPLSFFRQHEVNDHKNFKTLIEGAISMALIIQHAWNEKQYLDSLPKLRQSLCAWQKMSVGLIYKSFTSNYHGEDLDDLLDTYNILTKRFVDDDTGNITFNF